MFSTEVSLETHASASQVWKFWSDVSSWSKWDQDVEHCQLTEGPFQKGAKALLKPRGGPKVNIEIVECVVNRKFVSHSFLPLTTIVFYHEVEPKGAGKSVITHRIEFNGFLAPFFYCVMGRGIVKRLPQALKNLVALAEKDRG